VLAIRVFLSRAVSGFRGSHCECGAQACILVFRVNHNSVTPIIKMKSKMEHGFPATFLPDSRTPCQLWPLTVAVFPYEPKRSPDTGNTGLRFQRQSE